MEKERATYKLEERVANGDDDNDDGDYNDGNYGGRLRAAIRIMVMISMVMLKKKWEGDSVTTASATPNPGERYHDREYCNGTPRRWVGDSNAAAHELQLSWEGDVLQVRPTLQAL